MKQVKVLTPFVSNFKSFKKGQIIDLDDIQVEQFSKHGLVEIIEQKEEVQTEEPKEIIDYSKLKVAELKELLNEKGIEIPKGAKKADLISLLSK